MPSPPRRRGSGNDRLGEMASTMIPEVHGGGLVPAPAQAHLQLCLTMNGTLVSSCRNGFICIFFCNILCLLLSRSSRYFLLYVVCNCNYYVSICRMLYMYVPHRIIVSPALISFIQFDIGSFLDFFDFFLTDLALLSSGCKI